LPPLRLADGRYSIDVIVCEPGVRFLDRIESAVAFHVNSTALGNRNWEFKQASGHGHTLWDVRYRLCDEELSSHAVPAEVRS